MPLILVVGKANEVPSHKLLTKEKLGVVCGTITTVCCVEKRQDAVLLLSGVKVYVALFWLSKAGDHVPVMELSETVGKVSCPLKQMESIKLKVGTVDGIIFTVCWVGVGHPTAGVEIVGVKVYVVVFWLSKAGDHVPKAPVCVETGKSKLSF